MNQSLTQVAEGIAQDIVRLAQVMLEDKGIAVRSRVSNNFQPNASLDGNIVIEILFDNYMEYLEGGKATGKRPPMHSLREWALRKGIPVDNGTLYTAATAIARDGIMPRPILATLEKQIDEQFNDEWADKLFDAVIEELSNYFED